MRIRDIFLTNTRRAILLRGVVAISVGLLIAAVITATTDTNGFRRFAFPIFVVPAMLTIMNLLAGAEGKRKGDKSNEA